MYTQRFYKLICLHLHTDCFIEISLQSTGHFELYVYMYIKFSYNSFAVNDLIAMKLDIVVLSGQEGGACAKFMTLGPRALGYKSRSQLTFFAKSLSTHNFAVYS